jgi:hypothetical protein
VPELARRMTACSCRHDPARALVPVLTAMPGAGIGLSDILSDSGPQMGLTASPRLKANRTVAGRRACRRSTQKAVRVRIIGIEPFYPGNVYRIRSVSAKRSQSGSTDVMLRVVLYGMNSVDLVKDSHLNARR